MKKTLSIAIMACLVSLSTQAEFKECHSEECNGARGLMTRVFDMFSKVELVLPNGKVQTVSSLKNLKYRIEENLQESTIRAVFLDTSCEQNILLGKFFKFISKYEEISVRGQMFFDLSSQDALYKAKKLCFKD